MHYTKRGVRTDADVGSDPVPVRGGGLDLEGDMARRHVAEGRRQQGVLRRGMMVTPCQQGMSCPILRRKSPAVCDAAEY